METEAREACLVMGTDKLIDVREVAQMLSVRKNCDAAGALHAVHQDVGQSFDFMKSMPTMDDC